MRTTEAARYARWAAAAAILLVVIVAGVYLRRSWQTREAAKSAPPSVPATVHQRSAEFSFSKVENDRTLFTVRASHATEFRQGNRSLLEDVWITIYGRQGSRFDNIHTHACDYLSDTGRIVCAGEVQIDLESAEDAREHPAQVSSGNSSARLIHVGTSNVTFDRETGEARTDRPVDFSFPYGQGRAVGVVYNSERGVVRLQRDVELKLQPAGSVAQRGAAESMTLTGGSLEYHRDDRTLRLLAPVVARQGQRELTAGQLALELDADLRARRLVAAGERGGSRPELRSADKRGRAVLVADRFVAFFHPRGWTERIEASGNVRGTSTGSTGEDHLEAQQLVLEMVAKLNQPRLLVASGGVKAQSSHRGASRRLETAAMRLSFVAAQNSRGQRLDHGESLAPATMEWTAPDSVAGKSVNVTTKLQGQQVTAEFDPRNRLKTLAAHNGVEAERRLPGRPPQVSTSRELVARFDRAGEWTELDQNGAVRVREGDRTAQADRARLERATQNYVLSGSVVLTDSGTRSTAQSVSFNQVTGEMRAEGDVRTTDLGAGRSGIANLAPQPAHVAADRLQTSSSGGQALYTGHARLWQGDSVIEADSIQLFRDAKTLNARGHVVAVFPQAPGTPASPRTVLGSPGPTKESRPDLWRIRAGTLAYSSVDARALLEDGVNAESRQVTINSRVLELFLVSVAASPGSLANAPAGGGGAQQLARAVATGNVTVRQGDRRGTSERAEYTASDGKMVLSGGRPTLYDAFRGTTTGRQLTFFFSSDTIVVDSEQGSRTLTRHRVEK